MGQQLSEHCPGHCFADSRPRESEVRVVSVAGQEKIAEKDLFERHAGADIARLSIFERGRRVRRSCFNACGLQDISCGIERLLTREIGDQPVLVHRKQYDNCPGAHVESKGKTVEKYYARQQVAITDELPEQARKDYGDSIYGGQRGELPVHLANLRREQQDFLQKYKIGKRLASGAQGVTYMATEKSSNRVVVVKKPNNAIDISDYTLLKDKTHPNIVRVFDLFQNPLDTYIVLEFCSGGDLFSAIENIKNMTQNWCAAVMKQAFQGATYLHLQFKESHNDIKPENILLDRKVKSLKDVPRVMLADFGCLGPIGEIGTDDGGDPRYRAPEVFRGSYFSDKTDAWALGVSLFEVMTGGLMIHINRPNISGWMKFVRTPDCKKLMDKLMASKRVDLSAVPVDKNEPEMGSKLHQLLNGLLNTWARSRTTCVEAVDHPWFKIADDKGEIVLPEEIAEKLRRRGRMKVLNSALLNLIGDQLQGESIQYYKNIWDKYETDHRGTMQYKEFQRMLEDIGVVGKLDSPSAEAFFALADVNKSGYVEFKEFVALMFSPDQLDSADRASYFKKAFYFLSGDASKITSAQFAKLFETRGADENMAVIDRLFNDIDTNRNGSIDYKEFVAYIDNL
mmetsp:Transcript_33978/g.60078  ORF Transcript_33978/g.60078 Transcript_33978/m.60078 type:complete len:625 (-) Transcript_33978:137-2011(-)